MGSRVIAAERIASLNDKEVRDGDYTLYWMQQSQRAESNHALEFAIQRANENKTRLLVCFGVMDDYPDANYRHYHFMLQGLQETRSALLRRKIPLSVQIGHPAKVAIRLANKASEVICDRGYLRHQRQWRSELARSVACRAWQVESDAIVPVERASDKAEYAARTIRPRLHRALSEFLEPLNTTPIEKDSLNLKDDGIDISRIDSVLEQLKIDADVAPVDDMQGGTSSAKKRLKSFLKESLSNYDDRSAILDSHVSRLSPYLHFGQISPLSIAHEVKQARGRSTDQKDSFLEELLVRRELAINFVHYTKHYDSLRCLPDWATTTLDVHEDDPREYQYTASELEHAETHDPVWNASMVEMTESGYLHNHLRMYWGKKIIEWTNTYNHAYRVALELNNRYFLDGRDANSYANVAWLFGLHDRAHQEREIFGKVRYMSAKGLERKFDTKRYVKTIATRFETEIKGSQNDED